MDNDVKTKNNEEIAHFLNASDRMIKGIDVLRKKNRPLLNGHRYLTDDEFSVLQKTESYEDEYTDMWKTFFHAISIEQRKNYVCQRNLFPIWKRKHAVEFR